MEYKLHLYNDVAIAHPLYEDEAVRAILTRALAMQLTQGAVTSSCLQSHRKCNRRVLGIILHCIALRIANPI